MELQAFIDHVKRNGPPIVAAGRTKPEAPVPSCPDWTVADLVGHVGSVHRWAGGLVRSRSDEFRPFPDPPDGIGAVCDWYEEGLAELVATLEQVDPTAPVWNWVERSTGPASFWHRRMTHETAIHRWDADNAVGETPTLDLSQALDGIDEWLWIMSVKLTRSPEPELKGNLGLAATDSGLRCTVSLSPESLVRADGIDRADGVVHGPASDLLLWLLRRETLEDGALRLDGDETPARAWTAVKF